MNTPTDIRELIKDALYCVDDDYDFINDISTFDECGLLTGDEGIVIDMADGTEFHITIQQSR